MSVTGATYTASAGYDAQQRKGWRYFAIDRIVSAACATATFRQHHSGMLGKREFPSSSGTTPRRGESWHMVARTILTYDGMQAAPDDGLRRELLGGDLYVSPAPSPAHQSVVGAIFIVLDAYAKKHGGKAYTSPIDVVFSQVDATQPDVIYLGPERQSLIGAKNIQGAPSLLVEVLSPSSSDIDPARKLRTYARHGVPEYWIVDAGARTIVVHTGPSGERYLHMSTSTEGTIDSITLPGLRFSLPEDDAVT